MELFHQMISGLLGIPERQISSTLHLLGEGATIPFISRYRKEATGGLNEVQIENIKEQHDKLCDIARRKETILSTINEQGKLTPEARKAHQRHLESYGTGGHLPPLQTQTEDPCRSGPSEGTGTTGHDHDAAKGA